MHKLLVSLKEKRAFLDLSTTPAQDGVFGRPFVVIGTAMAQRHITMGYMTQHCDLPEEATDEGWAAFFADHDGDLDTAIENYKISLTAGEEGEKAEPEKKTATKTAQKKAAAKTPAADKAEA